MCMDISESLEQSEVTSNLLHASDRPVLYRRSGNFHTKNNLCLIFVALCTDENILMAKISQSTVHTQVYNVHVVESLETKPHTRV